MQVVCLSWSYYIKLKCPVDIIFLPNTCEAYTNTFYLPSRNSLSKEVDSRKIGSKLTNFTLEDKDVYDFALIKGLQIPNLTTDELTKLAIEMPEIQEVTIHSLKTKLKEINRNYPWLMPDWLKIVLTVTSTIIGIVFVVVIYLRRTSNCMLSGKHLNKKRKSKSIIKALNWKNWIALRNLQCQDHYPASLPTIAKKSISDLQMVQV